MQNPEHTAERLLTALEELGRQEEQALRADDGAALLAIQERLDPLVQCLTQLRAEKGSSVFVSLQTRGRAFVAARQQRLHHVTTQMQLVQDELLSVQQARIRLRNFTPAYGQPSRPSALPGFVAQA